MPARKCAGIKTAASTAAAILLLATVALLVTSCAAPQPASKPAALALTDSKKAALPPIDPKPAAQSPNSTIAPAIEVYFSNPLDGIGSIGPEAYLVQAIDAAQISVDMAIYNLSLENVASALIRARQRGVKVRLVMESEAMDRKQPLRLAQAGIPITGDQRKGLMHDKFTVIDNKEVWTGSMNYTTTSAYSDFNDLLCLESTEAAQDYTVEFAEMFSENLFGPDIRAATPYPRASISSAEVEVYFAPDDRVAKHIITHIRSAEDSIDVMAFLLTNDSITNALLERAAAGVSVRGVFDEGQFESAAGSDTRLLAQKGISVRQDGIDGLLHHKAIIIDDETVITGSYNFTINADRANDENVVILHDAGIAALYTRQFNIVYESGK